MAAALPPMAAVPSMAAPLPTVAPPPMAAPPPTVAPPPLAAAPPMTAPPPITAPPPLAPKQPTAFRSQEPPGLSLLSRKGFLTGASLQHTSAAKTASYGPLAFAGRLAVGTRVTCGWESKYESKIQRKYRVPGAQQSCMPFNTHLFGGCVQRLPADILVHPFPIRN